MDHLWPDTCMLPTLFRQVAAYYLLVALLASSSVPGNPQFVRLGVDASTPGFTLWAAVAPVMSCLPSRSDF